MKNCARRRTKNDFDDPLKTLDYCPCGKARVLTIAMARCTRRTCPETDTRTTFARYAALLAISNTTAPTTSALLVILIVERNLVRVKFD
jgi:hypothetical protein